MALIDIDKFVSSVMHRWDDPLAQCLFYDMKVALEDQGLEYKDGEIVKTQRMVSSDVKEDGCGVSEDERIMEKIIATIHLYYGEPLEDEAKEMIAWLEKQGQKSAWSKDDERAFHHVLSVLEEYGEEHPSNSKFVCNWLKSIKARMEGDKV